MSKKRFITFGIFLMVFTLLRSPSLCISAATDGLLLWFNKILPSLLPFIILINMLAGLNIMKYISRLALPLTVSLWHLPGSSLFAFIMGLIAGYPMGGKVVKQLVENKNLSISEGEKTLCFCNNCGPLFIIGTVGTLMLGDTHLGYFLFYIHLLSAFIISLIFSFYRTSSLDHTYSGISTSIQKNFSFSHLFNQSVQSAMDTLVGVGGYIIFFSVLARVITSSQFVHKLVSLPFFNQVPSTYILGLVTGLLELSNGTDALATSSSNTLYALALLSAIISFGGLCIYFQTLYILEDIPLSTMPYLIAKTLQGCLSFILTALFYPLFSMYTSKTVIDFQSRWLIALFLFILICICIIKLLNNINLHKFTRLATTSA